MLDTSYPSNLSRPFKKTSSIKKRKPITSPPSFSISWAPALAVPAVASRSSTKGVGCRYLNYNYMYWRFWGNIFSKVWVFLYALQVTTHRNKLGMYTPSKLNDISTVLKLRVINMLPCLTIYGKNFIFLDRRWSNNALQLHRCAAGVWTWIRLRLRHCFRPLMNI